MPQTPKEFDATIARIIEVMPEEGAAVRAMFDHYEKQVLTHHGAFVKLMIYVVRMLIQKSDRMITSPIVNRAITEILRKPFATHYDDLTDDMNKAVIYRMLEQIGAGKHWEDQTEVVKKLKDPMSSLADRVSGKKKDWNPELTKKAVIDLAFYHLSIFNAKRHNVVKPTE